MKTKRFLGIAILSLLIVFSCGSKPKSLENESSEVEDVVTAPNEEEVMEYEEAEDFPLPSKPMSLPVNIKDYVKLEEIQENEVPPEKIENEIPTKENKPFNPDDFYEARVKVKKTIYTHRTGDMVVWIGAKEFKKAVSKEYVCDSLPIPKDKRQYVKITPVAPEFEVDPKSSKCLTLDPTGTSATFTLKPLKGTHGKVDVSAEIELYETCDCTGSVLQKNSESYEISVNISVVGLLYMMWDILWDNFIAFFGTLVALIFAIIIFIIRKKSGIDKKE